MCRDMFLLEIEIYKYFDSIYLFITSILYVVVEYLQNILSNLFHLRRTKFGRSTFAETNSIFLVLHFGLLFITGLLIQRIAILLVSVNTKQFHHTFVLERMADFSNGWEAVRSVTHHSTLAN